MSQNAPSVSADAPASPAPAAPDTAQITSESADRVDPAESTSTSTEAPAGEEGEAAKPIKTAEQKELEALRRDRTRKERTNARLWQENQELRARAGAPPQQRQEPASGDAAGDGEERVQVTRKDFEQAANERARQLAASMNAEDKLAERCNALLDKGAKIDPKFDAAIVAVGTELPLFDGKGQPTAALEEILESTHAAKIVLHLRDNPDVASELADLTPRQLTRRLIALEAEVAIPTRQVSTAPRPLEPERGTSSGTGEPDPQRNPEAWRAWRNKTSKVR